MTFRPSNTIDGRTAIELWEEGRQVATIYAHRAGLHIVFSEPYYPDPHGLYVEAQDPAGLMIGIRSDE